MADSTAKIILSAEDRTAAAFGAVKSSLKGFNEQALQTSAALGALGASLTFAGMANFVKSTNDGIDALNDLKDATGASIENISALEDVADRSGTSLDTVGSALTKFNQALKDAKPDSDVAQALKQIGLSAAELKREDPADALLKTAQALSTYADDGDKARLVQELFGKSTKELAPFLKDLAESGRLVAKVTTEQADEAEKFNKQLFALEKNAKDAGRALVSDLVTGINAAAKAFKDSGLIEGIRTLLTGTDEFKNNKQLVSLTDQLLESENRLDKARSTFGQNSVQAGRAEKRIAQVKEELRVVQNYQQVLSQAAAKPADTRSSVGDLKLAPKGGGKSRAEEIDESRRALASYVQALQGNLNTVEKLTETEKAHNFLRTLGTRGEIPQVKELVLGLAAQIEAEKELVLVLQQKRAASTAEGDEVNRKNADYQQRLKGLIDAGPSANLEKQRADVRLLTDEFEAGRVSEELYLEAVSTRLSLTNDNLKDTNTFAKDLGLTFTSSFEDAIAGGKELSDVLKGLGQDLLKLSVRTFITEPVGKSLTDAFKGFSQPKAKQQSFDVDNYDLQGGGGGGGGFSINSLLSFFGGFFADGGNPPMGKVSVVGERGPELFVPKVPGTIVPNNAFGGKGINQNLTVNVDSRTDQAEVGRAIKQAVRAGNAELIGQLELARG